MSTSFGVEYWFQMVVVLLFPHLLFPQRQQVLPQSDSCQQRGTTQQQRVAFLPLAAAAKRVLVAHAHPQASGRQTGAAASHSRPRVVRGPVHAAVRGQRRPRRLLELGALL